MILVKKPNVSPERKIIFLSKFKMAAKSYVEGVIPELIDICFNVIPHFHMVFNAELFHEAINNL